MTFCKSVITQLPVAGVVGALCIGVGARGVAAVEAANEVDDPTVLQGPVPAFAKGRSSTR